MEVSSLLDIFKIPNTGPSIPDSVCNSEGSFCDGQLAISDLSKLVLVAHVDQPYHPGRVLVDQGWSGEMYRCFSTYFGTLPFSLDSFLVLRLAVRLAHRACT